MLKTCSLLMRNVNVSERTIVNIAKLEIFMNKRQITVKQSIQFDKAIMLQAVDKFQWYSCFWIPSIHQQILYWFSMITLILKGRLITTHVILQLLSCSASRYPSQTRYSMKSTCLISTFRYMCIPPCCCHHIDICSYIRHPRSDPVDKGLLYTHRIL